MVGSHVERVCIDFEVSRSVAWDDCGGGDLDLDPTPPDSHRPSSSGDIRNSCESWRICVSVFSARLEPLGGGADVLREGHEELRKRGARDA